MTVAGNIAFGMEIRKVPKEEREKAIKQVADMLQIGHLLDRKPSQLSGGQRQRVAMGRALVRDPQVFLFDEPLSNLDAKLRVDMRTEIKRLHQRMKTTIVYVTHDQIEAMTLATQDRSPEGRRIAAVRNAGGDLQSPRQYVRCRLHGLARHEPPDGEGGEGAAWIAGFARSAERRSPLKLPVNGSGGGLGAHAGKDVIFGIRPEALTDPDGADRNAHSLAEGDCLIEVVEPAGSDTFAIVRLGGKSVVARLRADARIAPGQTARLAFNLDKAVFFDPQSQVRIA